MLVAFKFVPQSFPGLSPYPLASVNSPPDGGFPTQTHHQHPAAEPDGGYNDPGFNHLAEPGNGGHSQGGGGDGYHQQQQDSSYPQVGLKLKYIYRVVFFNCPPPKSSKYRQVWCI